MLLKEGTGDEFDMMDKFEGYVFLDGCWDMLFNCDDMFLFVDDMFVAFDVDMVFDDFCLPLLFVIPPAVEREPGHAFGSRAFLRWQSTQ